MFPIKRVIVAWLVLCVVLCLATEVRASQKKGSQAREAPKEDARDWAASICQTHETQNDVFFHSHWIIEDYNDKERELLRRTMGDILRSPIDRTESYGLDGIEHRGLSKEGGKALTYLKMHVVTEEDSATLAEFGVLACRRILRAGFEKMFKSFLLHQSHEKGTNYENTFIFTTLERWYAMANPHRQKKESQHPDTPTSYVLVDIRSTSAGSSMEKFQELWKEFGEWMTLRPTLKKGSPTYNLQRLELLAKEKKRMEDFLFSGTNQDCRPSKIHEDLLKPLIELASQMSRFRGEKHTMRWEKGHSAGVPFSEKGEDSAVIVTKVHYPTERWLNEAGLRPSRPIVEIAECFVSIYAYFREIKVREQYLVSERMSLYEDLTIGYIKEEDLIVPDPKITRSGDLLGCCILCTQREGVLTIIFEDFHDWLLMTYRGLEHAGKNEKDSTVRVPHTKESVLNAPVRPSWAMS